MYIVLAAIGMKAFLFCENPLRLIRRAKMQILHSAGFWPRVRTARNGARHRSICDVALQRAIRISPRNFGTDGSYSWQADMVTLMEFLRSYLGWHCPVR